MIHLVLWEVFPAEAYGWNLGTRISNGGFLLLASLCFSHQYVHPSFYDFNVFPHLAWW